MLKLRSGFDVGLLHHSLRCTMIALFFVPLMALLSRTAGGGYLASRLPSFLPEMLFGITIGIGGIMAAGILDKFY